MSISPFKDDILKNKVVFITGGGTGICFGIAMAYGLHGAKVAICGRRKQVLEDACKKLTQLGIDCMYTECDVRDSKKCEMAVESTFRHFGGIDVLVNGAAGNFLASMEDLSPNAFSTVIQIDLIGTFNMTHAALPFLKKSKSGLVVNISAKLEGTPYQSHAASAKAGIDALTKNWAVEWIEYGIRVVGIAPGPIEGTVGMSKLSPGSDSKKSDKSIGSHGESPRWGTIDEIAYVALFLSTWAADYINGVIIPVDGGHHLQTRLFVPKNIYESIRKKSKL
jgi:peroxisomal 2,4-dienoyl-CoA reductase